MKRIFALFLCLIFLVASFVLTASAETLDYTDYISDIVVNGDKDLITVSFPVDSFVFNLYSLSSDLIDSVVGSSCLFELPANVPVQLGFGSSFDISLDNIPSDTQFTVVFDTSVQHGFIDETNISYQGWFYYLNSSGGSSWVEVNGFRDSGTLTIQGNLDSSFASFIPFFYFYNFSANPVDASSSVDFGITVRSFQATFSISSLYRLQEQTGQINSVLKEVEKQLVDQGKKLDDIIGGSVVPQTPPGSDIVGDLDAAEGQIRNEAASGLQQGEDVQQNALEVLGSYLSAFACVSWIFDRFAMIPFFSALLSLSFSLGICGAILGLGFSVVSSLNRDRNGKYEHSGKKRSR